MCFSEIIRARMQIASLATALLLLPAALTAQQTTETNRIQFELTPLLGYRTTVSFPIQPAVQGSNSKVVFDSDPSYGFAAGMRFHEDDVIEFRWARQDSSAHLEDVTSISSRQRITIDQYHGDFTHEYILDQWPKWARPYVIGSVGATHVAGSADTNFTRFSFGLGGGVKFLAGQHLGFRFQGEWLPIVLNPHAAVFCGGGCIVHVGGTLGSQGEAVIGPFLRF